MRKTTSLGIILSIFLALTAIGCDDGEGLQLAQDTTEVILTGNLGNINTGSTYEIRGFAIDGDILELCFEFGGGCEEHIFELFAANWFYESYPVQVAAKISHNGLDDTCEAVVNECFEYDLFFLRNAYYDAYQVSEGTIIIQLEGLEDTISYTF